MIRRLKVMICLLIFHATASTVWAQSPAHVPDEEKSWLKWLIAGGLAAVISIAGFMNSKRSHMT